MKTEGLRTLTTTWKYGLGGRLTRKTAPDGVIIHSYAPAGNELITGVKTSDETLVTRTKKEYNLRGEMITETHVLDSVTKYITHKFIRKWDKINVKAIIYESAIGDVTSAPDGVGEAAKKAEKTIKVVKNAADGLADAGVNTGNVGRKNNITTALSKNKKSAINMNIRTICRT